MAAKIHLYHQSQQSEYPLTSSARRLGHVFTTIFACLRLY